LVEQARACAGPTLSASTGCVPARLTPQGRGLRAFNRETREWEHTWTDSLEPGHFHVWKGVFQDGKIDLFAEWRDAAGKRVQSRLTWSPITNDSAHWESSRSHDDGKTWQIHWVIDIRRRGTKAGEKG
jgi:hypothetical protein